MTFAEFYANEMFESMTLRSLFDEFKNNVNSAVTFPTNANAVSPSSPCFIDNLPMMGFDENTGFTRAPAGVCRFDVYLRVVQ